MSTLGALTQAWVSAAAALPNGWDLLGVVRRGTPVAGDLPNRRNEEQTHLGVWRASAGPLEGRLAPAMITNGYGDTPHQALNDLAIKLRELRGPTTG